MFNKNLKNFIKNAVVNNGFAINLIYILIAIVATLIFLNAIFVYKDFFFKDFGPIHKINVLLVILIAILVLAVFIFSNRIFRTFSFIKHKTQRFSKLRKRIIIAFSIGAALPTIIVAIFSTYFFNFGIESWFDNKISKLLDQSVYVGESYISEHESQLKETAISISDDLSEMYYDLIHAPDLFSKVLNAQAELRSIDEAIVFQKDTNVILAQTALSFSLSFTTIPMRLIQKANDGEIVKITSDPTKIRILIKLRDYNNTYLLIGKLIDSKIIDHIDKTNGAAREYFKLRDQISAIQIKFTIVFILLSFILLLAAIIWGRNFAERIVSPIRELVKAAEDVKSGDLSVQVPIEKLHKDELRVLSAAFNSMVLQISRQQKDLIVAQRSLAWSDVARRVAHEIKNPLTPIQLSAEFLLKKFGAEVNDKENFKKYVQNILRQSNDIKLIVSEFVEFARLPAPSFTKCNIVSMISDIVESRKLINDSIFYKFTSNVKSYDFVCDITQINRAVVNILLNAEEAFEQLKITKKIDVEIFAEQDFIKIIVKDNGSGFSNELLNSATEAYVTTKSQGTGLGLAIVDRIAFDHFGTLKISNVTNSGGMVVLTFDTKELITKLK